jgi:hypothetical protein
MAKLLPPTVGERLARCGTDIEVWGIMPNSDVDLDIDGTEQTITVSSTATVFTVAPLKAGALVSARQRLGTDKSEWSNKVKVEDVLLPPPPPRTEPSILRCAHCVGAWGVAPGSQVELAKGGLTIAEGDVDRNGLVCVGLKDHPSPGFQTTAITCGQGSAPSNVTTYSFGGQLPPPTIVKPVFECQNKVGLDGLFPGATVEIFVTDAGGNKKSLGSFCSCWKRVNAFVGYQMKHGDRLTAKQTMIEKKWECNLQGIESAEVKVEPPDVRIKPKIAEPIYEGASIILVINQVEGGMITLLSRDSAQVQEVDLGSRPSSEYPEVPVENLHAGQILRVRQELCGVKQVSDPVTVQPLPKTIDAPVVREPLYACSDILAVDHVIPGAQVFVQTTAANAPAGPPPPPQYPLGQSWASGSTVMVHLAPTLIENGYVTAYQEVGGKISPESKKVKVKRIKEMTPPTLVPPVRVGDTFVWVSGIIPGAYVRVFNGAVQIGGGSTVNTADAIPLYWAIPDKAIITATQVLCQESGPSAPQPAVAKAACPGPPKYDPGKWNDGGMIQGCNNCYNYACDIRTDNFAQPGGGTNPECNSVTTGAVNDGLRQCKADHCHPCHHRVALVIAPGYDFHWYRQDDTGWWSHKPGCGEARNWDESHNSISDPSTANRGVYTQFCGYFCVYKPDVKIAGFGCKCWH